jgi:hypothetical protein
MAKTQTLGTVLRVETDTPDSFVPVGNLTRIGVPGPTKPEIDVTDFDSTAAEFLAGLPDNGELPFSGIFNYANQGQALMLADAHDPDAPVRTFQIEFTRQNVEFTFEGWVKSFVPTAGGPNEAYTFDGSIRVTGAVAIDSIS